MLATEAPLEESRKARAARAAPTATLALALVLAVSAGWITGGVTRAGDWLRSLFELYVEAQLTMLEASGNLNREGEAEYALVLREPLDEIGVRALDEAHPRARYLRRTPFGGAVVVAMTPGDRAGLEALRADPRIGAVVPNRGLWICH